MWGVPGAVNRFAFCFAFSYSSSYIAFFVSDRKDLSQTSFILALENKRNCSFSPRTIQSASDFSSCIKYKIVATLKCNGLTIATKKHCKHWLNAADIVLNCIPV